MRKLIVLIMTSVLATGAVANADDVNVTADPGKLIRIVELQKMSNGTDTTSRTSLAADEKLQVYDNPMLTGSEQYTIDLEVVDENDTLEQVAVCLFDSNVLTGADIATTCGSGFDDPGSVTNAHAEIETGNGVKRPQSAVQMAFIPSIYDPSDPTKQAIGNPLEANTAGNTVVIPTYLNSTEESLVSQKDQFDGELVGSENEDNVWDLVFRFGLKKFAHNSPDWKIRVVATYAAGAEPDGVFELIDTETYTVDYFGEFDTVERQSQDFGNVIDGGFKEITGITTGEYYANFASDISIAASAFEDTSDTALTFGTTASPADGEVSMKCVGTNSGIEKFMEDGSAKKLLDSVPANSSETTAAAATAVKVADTHDCTLYIGDNVATGAYDNVMTVAIGKEQ